MEIGIFEINYQTDGDLTLPVYRLKLFLDE
jgi:hypothetical protein